MYNFRILDIMRGLFKKELYLKQAAYVILQVNDIRGKLKAGYKLGLKQEGSNTIRFENQNLESGLCHQKMNPFRGKMLFR